MSRRRIPKSTWLPIVLLLYLAAMSYIGWPPYASGKESGLYYFGIIGFTLLVIAGVHFFYKKRERMQKEREDGLNA